MAKLIWKTGESQTEREIREGDLVLISSSPTRRWGSNRKLTGYTLGVFQSLKSSNTRDSPKICLDKAYHLHKPESLGGITIPLISKSSQTEYFPNRSFNLYIGSNEIMVELKRAGMGYYAEMVSQMDSPFLA